MRPRKLRRCRWIPPGRDPPPRPRRAPGTRAWRNCRKTEGRGECRTLGVGCVAVRELVTSAAASPRLELAREWLRERGPAGRALVVGATQEAAAEAVRTAVAGAAFGWQRFTLGRLAAAVAAQAMSARGLSPLSPLGVEAVCARVVHQLRGRLGKFDPVATQPGLPRALSRTIQELRLAGARPGGDLGRVLDAYETELGRAALADRAAVFRLALEAESPLLDLPALLVDLPLRAALEERFIARLRGPVLAIAPAADATRISRALDVAPRPLREAADTSLARVHQRLFVEGTAPVAASGDDVILLSAPGESRECVEIARLVRSEAERGVPFDGMAVLLRSPFQYRPLLEEAFVRAGIPAHFASGTQKPKPAGRAFPALPLLDALASLPASATWAAWLDPLSALATRALRDPARVLSLLAELAPMGPVGPVSLAEVRLVLARRLTELSIPPSGKRHGKVFIAPVAAARGLSFDSVFVPGLAEKLFPQKVMEDPLLRDSERLPLAELETSEGRIAAERLALRLAVGAACGKVVLSWPRIDLSQGRARVPSFYGLEVVRAAEGTLPGFADLARRAERALRTRAGWPAPRDAADAIDDAEHDLALLALALQDPKASKGTAAYLLAVNPHLSRSLRSRARRGLRRWTPADGLVQPAAAALEALQAHQPARRSYSPTALQNYAACPDKFVLQAIHRLAPPEIPG